MTPAPQPTTEPSETVAPTPAPTATATPTPRPTSTPALPPPAAGGSNPTPTPPSVPAPPKGEWPGPQNTGVPVGTALTAVGGMRVTTPNQVLDSLDISGQVVIDAPGVVIKNSRIHGTASDAYGVYVVTGSVTVTDSEIFGFANAIAFTDWTAIRVNIHGTTQDGAKLGDNTLLQDSWIHDLTPEAGAHSDGAQLQDGAVNVAVKHNYIDSSSASGGFGNSALFIAPDLGPSTVGPLTITGNYLNGGNYTIYIVDGANGKFVIGNISVTNNSFGHTARYGPSSTNVPFVQSGNIWADTGKALRL